jgi:hypothetical protein
MSGPPFQSLLIGTSSSPSFVHLREPLPLTVANDWYVDDFQQPKCTWLPFNQGSCPSVLCAGASQRNASVHCMFACLKRNDVSGV